MVGQLTQCGRACTPTLAGALAIALALLNDGSAGDWPQILGPNRNGIAIDEAAPRPWPQSGPRVVWQRAVGQGYAGVAVAGDHLILFHRIGNEEIAELLNTADGKSRWKVAFPTSFRSSFSSDHGPRCVPLIHQGRVYLFGSAGGLRCIDLGGGQTVWSRETHQEYKAPEGYFGAGSSPLVMGDRLLVNVGGPEGAGVVAFKLATGATLWSTGDELASYSSPVAATINGVSQAVFVTRYNALGIDPASGRVLWSFPFGMRGPTVNAASPLVLDTHLFLSASYGIGAVCADLKGGKPKILWQGDDVMSSQYTTSVYKDGVLYGIDGRDDQGVARMRCFDPKTGRVHWTQEGIGKAALILAGDRIIVQTTNGQLLLVEANPKQFKELARAQVLEGRTYALPALSNGLLFVRDTSTLKCLEVNARP
jgi:outer membrane protein assembly factor BamB